MRRLESDSPTVPNPSRGSSVGQSGGLIIRRSGVRVPTPVLPNQPELSQQTPPLATTCGEPIKSRHPVSVRPFLSLSGPRLLPNMLPSCQAHDTIDPGLAAVVAAWPELPEAIRAGIVAMVKAASGSEK